MKRNIEVGLATLAFAVAFLAFTPTLRAQPQNQSPSAQHQPNQQPAQQQNQTFAGQIIQTKSGQYALLWTRTPGKVSFWITNRKPKSTMGKMLK